MQFILWTGIVVLGLVTLVGVGTIFFQLVGEFRQAFAAQPPAVLPKKRSRHEGLRKVDLESLRDDRPPARRAA